MRVLVAVVHYFKAEEKPRHSSTDANRQAERAAAVRNVIDAWRGHVGPSSMMNVHPHRYERVRGPAAELDIAIITSGDDHLLDAEHANTSRLRVVRATVDNPRMLGFAAHKLFADNRHNYDLFVFSEDDLRPTDGSLIKKVVAFNDAFGDKRVLLPNRYEWNLKGPAYKTFIDGDLRPDVIAKYEQSLPDELFLRQMIGSQSIVYRRATNPHSGFFAITSQQLAYWMAQPHFLDLDCSFVSPLESSASLGVMKTFSVFKSWGADMGWLEIEHLDHRFTRRAG